MRRYTFGAELWPHDGEASWTFLTVPAGVSANTVRLGGTTWSTSEQPLVSPGGGDAAALPRRDRELRGRPHLRAGGEP